MTLIPGTLFAIWFADDFDDPVFSEAGDAWEVVDVRVAPECAASR